MVVKDEEGKDVCYEEDGKVIYFDQYGGHYDHYGYYVPGDEYADEYYYNYEE